MLEFIFDSTRTISNLVFTGLLGRYPNIQWIFTHGAGTLPLLADRMELFRPLLPGGAGDPTVQEQVRELLFVDIASTRLPHQVPALIAAFGPDSCFTAATTAGPQQAGTASQIASIDAAAQPDGDTWRALTSRNGRLFPRLTGEPSQDLQGQG